MIIAEDLIRAVEQVRERYPDANLTTNLVHNIRISNGGEYVGWIDMKTGEVEFLDQDHSS